MGSPATAFESTRNTLRGPPEATEYPVRAISTSIHRKDSVPFEWDRKTFKYYVGISTLFSLSHQHEL